MLGVPFAFSFFSTLGGKTEIEAHSGPANLRVRCHLPLVVPGKKEAGERGGGEWMGVDRSMDGQGEGKGDVCM